MTFLDRTRTVDDLDRSRVEDWTWIRQAERPHGIETTNEVGRDPLEAERAVDAQARTELIGFEDFVGVCVDPCPELGHPRGLHGEAGCLTMTTELDEQICASLE